METPDSSENVHQAIIHAEFLLSMFRAESALEEKLEKMASHCDVDKFFAEYPLFQEFIQERPPIERYCFGLLVLLHKFSSIMEGLSLVKDPHSLLQEMASALVGCERFYEPMGGLLWYYLTTLQLIEKQKKCILGEEVQGIEYKAPPFYDFRKETSYVTKILDEGLKALPETAEVYTVGGAGERLGLIDPIKKEPLPVAFLRFLGKSTLEHLFRDLEAREYLYEKRYGKSLSLPVIMMTSQEQGNAEKIEALLEQNDFFGRPKEHILRVVQPLVPLIDCEGNFALKAPLSLAEKPGGHGVLWRLMLIKHVFPWLHEKKIAHLIIRQINNPLGGTDSALLALVGLGSYEKKLFGFASCPRRDGLAEGLNVLKVKKEERYHSSLSNLEYTAFNAILKEDPSFFSRQTFFANTNLLYAHVTTMEEFARRIVAPGALVNLKSEFSLFQKGETVRRKACRLESTMQNIADEIQTVSEDMKGISRETLGTFLNVHDRLKLFSVTKRSFTSLEAPLETPEYCLYDWYRMTRLLLQEIGSHKIPEEQTFEQFFKEGPNILFLFHPALGPLWSEIGEKIIDLELLPYSEVELELAEATLRSVSVQGALKIRSMLPCGKKGKPASIPRVFLSHVSVLNRGFLRPASLESVLQGTYAHEEKVEWILEEGSEIHAEHIVFHGSMSITVPAYTRMTLLQDQKTKAISYRQEKKPFS